MAKTKVKCAGASDLGLMRRNNEDAFYIDADRGIFLVVDGIGGQAAGEKAAEIAIERVRARLERRTGAAEQRVREAIAVANNEILRVARSNKEWEGMACVLTLAVLENGSAVAGHVGDSRLYHVRGGQIRKITHDHSPVGEREDSGELTETEAMRHPRRNEVFRDVGSEEHAPDDPDFIEIQRFPFEPDSALVLCSDGLSDQVASQRICDEVIRNAGSPDSAARQLIGLANRAGGKDNVTVVVVEGEEFADAARPEMGGRGAFPRWAQLAAGCVLSLGLGFLAGRMSAPKPPKPAPPARVLTAGPGAAFGSISEALAQARPGDAVEVLAGEYAEQVRLKSGVTLRARDAILRAAPMGNGPAVIAERVANARVTGFRIEAGDDAPLPVGILLTDSDVELEDIEVSGAGVGIEIRGAAKPVLRANSIHDCTDVGILISGPSEPWISHNTLRGNTIGLAARDGARPALSGNVFDGNGATLPPEISMADVRARNLFVNIKPARSRGRKKP